MFSIVRAYCSGGFSLLSLDGVSVCASDNFTMSSTAGFCDSSSDESAGFSWSTSILSTAGSSVDTLMCVPMVSSFLVSRGSFHALVCCSGPIPMFSTAIVPTSDSIATSLLSFVYLSTTILTSCVPMFIVYNTLESGFVSSYGVSILSVAVVSQ